MASRSRANPLALAVLGLLSEQPMHPYGSLYGVVEGLEKRGLVTAVETRQEGRRPQRTVYAITEAGKVEMNEWLAELVSVPVKEYPQFEAALSFLPGLPPDEAVPLLDLRCQALEVQLDQL